MSSTRETPAKLQAKQRAHSAKIIPKGKKSSNKSPAEDKPAKSDEEPTRQCFGGMSCPQKDVPDHCLEFGHRWTTKGKKTMMDWFAENGSSYTPKSEPKVEDFGIYGDYADTVKTGLTLGLDKPPLPPATTTMTTVSAVLEFGEKVKEWTSVMETYKLEVEEEQAKQDITPVSVQGEVDELRAKLYVLETENGELRESVDSANSKAEFLATAIKALAELVFSMATSNTSDSRAILENTRQTLTRVFGSSAAEDSE